MGRAAARGNHIDIEVVGLVQNFMRRIHIAKGSKRRMAFRQVNDVGPAALSGQGIRHRVQCRVSAFLVLAMWIGDNLGTQHLRQKYIA